MDGKIANELKEYIRAKVVTSIGDKREKESGKHTTRSMPSKSKN
jgi:hypothetical protein